jgi:hypothetical protein
MEELPTLQALLGIFCIRYRVRSYRSRHRLRWFWLSQAYGCSVAFVLGVPLRADLSRARSRLAVTVNLMV